MKVLNDQLQWVDSTQCQRTAWLRSNVYLLTRFNLKFWSKVKSGMNARSEEWLSKRFLLFETFCVPSVARQTHPSFAWFCLFAEDTPPRYLRRIREIKKSCPQLYPLLLTDAEGHEHARCLTAWIDRIRNDHQPLYTLRIDNDDAIARDFIERAIRQKEVQTDTRVVYWFDGGIQYYPHRQVAFSYKAPHNHYPFLINTDPQNEEPNILAFSHRGNLPAGYTERVLSTQEMWMEVVHEDNVMNEVALTLCQQPYTSNERFRQRFSLSEGTRLTTRNYHYLTFLLPRMLRHLIRRIQQKLLHRT